MSNAAENLVTHVLDNLNPPIEVVGYVDYFGNIFQTYELASLSLAITALLKNSGAHETHGEAASLLILKYEKENR